MIKNLWELQDILEIFLALFSCFCAKLVFVCVLLEHWSGVEGWVVQWDSLSSFLSSGVSMGWSLVWDLGGPRRSRFHWNILYCYVHLLPRDSPRMLEAVRFRVFRPVELVFPPLQKRMKENRIRFHLPPIIFIPYICLRSNCIRMIDCNFWGLILEASGNHHSTGLSPNESISGECVPQ